MKLDLQCPRYRQYPDRRLHPEQDIPTDGRDEEDGSDDVQVNVGGSVVTREQTQLERGLKTTMRSAKHPTQITD